MLDPIANGEDGEDIRILKLNPSLAKSNLLGEYDVAVTYPANVIIWHLGVQYVSLQAANTGNTPATEPTWWAIYSPPELYQVLDAKAHAIIMTPQDIILDGTTPVDIAIGNKVNMVLIGSNVMSLIPPDNACNIVLRLEQGTGGSATIVAWENNDNSDPVLWPGGTAPTLSTAVGAVDIISLYWDGSDYYGSFSLDFS